MDVINQQYKDQIVQPCLESLNEEGERTLLGAMRSGFISAKESLTNALIMEEDRYERGLEGKTKPLDLDTVNRLIAIYGNLIAAEEALKELFIHVKGLQAQGGQ